MSQNLEPYGPVLSPGDVAYLFGVNAKTVTRWADKGLLPCFITLGGHRRFTREAVAAALDKGFVKENEDA